ncbi:MAG TPA: hypothetical protein PKN32_03520 [Bacteroidales bacterium]|nr:hypothetical protein [Bacteroidales bacterium]
MKTRIILSIIFVAFATTFISCGGNKESAKEIITKKIMYDVSIVNEDLVTQEDFERDWFWLNIPDVDLEKLRIKLFDDVKSGKIKSYYYDVLGDYEKFELIPNESLVNLFEKEWYVFEYIDVKKEESEEVKKVANKVPIAKDQIIALRFLEEWYYENDEFCKRVIAVAPVFTYEVPGQSKGINVLYWVNIKDIK